MMESYVVGMWLPASIAREDSIFQGTIALASADNFGANALGGFKEGSTAHRPCRQCLGTMEEIQEKASIPYLTDSSNRAVT